MRHDISSSITSVIMVFAIIIIGIIILSSLYRTLLFPESLNILYSSLSMLLGFFIGRWILNLKRVELAEKGFYISSDIFFDNRETFVPFEEIEIVRQSFFAQKNPEFEIVSIKFLVTTTFGKKIWFIPKTNYFGSPKHSIARELNQIVAKKKRFIS